MKITKNIPVLSAPQWMLYGALFCVGIFHVYLSCALSALMLVWLLVRLVRRGALTVSVSLTGIALVVLVGGYGVTPLWAVDGGDAVFGFFKFLPVLLYSLVLMQQEDGREQVINGLPYGAVAMTVLSVIGMYIPGLSSFFTVADRLAGFVQYPNTFALILLVAQLLLVTKERPRVWDYAGVAVLLAGILYTGSRTVLVLAVAANAVALFTNKSHRVRWITLGCIAGGAAAVVIYCAVTDNFLVLARYLRFSLEESTFVGRLLYAYDALPVILRHPFGLGYMGYYHLEQSIQTGVYSVLSVHNDLLQILLDVGWIPAGLLLAAVVRTFVMRQVPLRYKLVLAVMLLHLCFDFDLQYVAVFMLLTVFMADPPLRVLTLRKKAAVGTAAVLLTVLCLYMSTVQGLTRFGRYEAAYGLYPTGTTIESHLLVREKDLAARERLADRILERNPYASVAYSAKAGYAYSKGDFAQVIRYKKQAIELAPFATAEYVEYAYMLATGIRLYQEAGMTDSAERCKRELISVTHALEALPRRLSPLGIKIKDQPDTALPEELATYVAALEKEGNG